MKRCSLFCAGWWSFLIFPVLLLLLIVFFKWSAIEQDVANNARNALAATHHDWVQVNTHHRGRDVLLAGIAANAEAIEQAKQIAQQAKGVRSVHFDGTIAVEETPPPQTLAPTPPVPQVSPSFEIFHEAGKLVLLGQVADQASIDALYHDAVAHYGQEQVINRLNIAENRKELPSLSGIFAAFRELGANDKIQFHNDVVKVTGSVDSLSVKKLIDDKLRDIFDGHIDNQLEVVLPPVEQEELIRKHECQVSLAELLDNSSIHFALGSSEVKTESFSLLDRISNMAQRCPQANFQISGHTDTVGDFQSNIELSKQRAQAVVDYMAQSGVDAKRFAIVGHGSNKPIADNDTEAGKAKNRRIEFLLIN